MSPMVTGMGFGGGEDDLYLFGGEGCPLGAIAGDFDFWQFFKGVEGSMSLVNQPLPKCLESGMVAVASDGGLVA